VRGVGYLSSTHFLFIFFCTFTLKKNSKKNTNHKNIYIYKIFLQAICKYHVSVNIINQKPLLGTPVLSCIIQKNSPHIFQKNLKINNSNVVSTICWIFLQTTEEQMKPKADRKQQAV